MRALPAALLSLLLVACSAPRDPLDAVVKAPGGLAFQSWRTRHEAKLPPAERAEFADALQEIRFELMGDRRLLSSAQMEPALRAEIHGRPVRAILVRAWRHKHARLDEERRLLRGVVQFNVQGEAMNAETQRVLDDTLRRQVDRLDQIEEEILWLEKRLRQLGSPVTEQDPAPDTTSPGGASPAPSPLPLG